MTAPLYKHSGTITIRGIGFAALVAFILGPLLALIYSAATIYIPFIYINALLCLGYGAAIGVAVHLALNAGHTRNSYATFGITLAVTFVTYYVGWVFWFGVQAFRADASFSEAFVLFFPPFLFDAIGELNEYGSWSLRGNEVTGIMLTLIWIIEAVIVFGASLFAAHAMASEEVYCESCKSWCEARANVRQYHASTDIHSVVHRVNTGDLAALREPTPPHPQDTAWHQLDLMECRSCGATNTLTIRTVTNTLNKKGENESKIDDILSRVLLTKEQAAWVAESAAPPAPEQGANRPL